MNRASSALLLRHRDRLERFEQLLNTLGYRQVLARGFALVRSSDGTTIRLAEDARTVSGALDIEFADGHIVASAHDAVAPRRTKPKLAKHDQGSLF